MKYSPRAAANENLAIILLAACLSACSPKVDDLGKAEEIGDDLLTAARAGEIAAGTGQIPGVVRIGPGLAAKLRSLAPVLRTDCRSQAFAGDASVGDGSATHHVLLTCQAVQPLGLRLRYDSGGKRFHILGYWTPSLVPRS